MSLRSRNTILIVEDEWLIAELLKDVLKSAGYAVIGPVARVEEAIRTVETELLDAAILDVTLRDTTSFEIARALAERSIPFMFMTGYVNNDLPVEFRNRQILSKPIDEAILLSSLDGIL